MKKSNIIIVGGNAAGPAAAAEAKRTNQEANVMLFESGEYISTGTCEIPYIFSGEIENPHSLVFFDEKSFFVNKGVVVNNYHLVNGIDSRNKSLGVINLKSGEQLEYSYDKLILTTGASSKKLAFDTGEYENLFYIKSISDGIKLKTYLAKSDVKEISVIGSNYIGLEMAVALQSAGYLVSLIDIENVPFHSASDNISRKILEVIESHNINFYGGQFNTSINSDGRKINRLNLDQGAIKTDLVIGATGVLPNNNLAKQIRLELSSNGAIITNNKCQSSDPNIYSAGDNSLVKNFLSHKMEYWPLATFAREHAYIAGANSAGAHKIVSPKVYNISIKIFDSVYSSVGMKISEADKLSLRYGVVSASAKNRVSVMPGSTDVFGQIIYNKEDFTVLGAEFWGARDVVEYSNLISMMIYNRLKINKLAEVTFSYNPPVSPFIHLLTKIARKI